MTDALVLLGLAADLPDDRLAEITRSLHADLLRTGVDAHPVDTPVAPGQKGDAFLLGQLALGLVTTGAVTALIECLKAYIARERTLICKLRRPNGTVIEISAKNVDSLAVKNTLDALSST